MVIRLELVESEGSNSDPDFSLSAGVKASGAQRFKKADCRVIKGAVVIFLGLAGLSFEEAGRKRVFGDVCSLVELAEAISLPTEHSAKCDGFWSMDEFRDTSARVI